MKNEKGVDALIQAIISSHPSLLPFLLLPTSAAGAGADPNSADADGTTALHYAAAYGELKSLTLLLQHGADPTRKNAFQWTAVAYSATQASEAYFKSLVGPAATVVGGGDVGGVGLGQRTGKVGQQGGGIRLVSDSEKGEELTEGFGVGDARPSRAWMGLERPGTPTERPGTPGEGRKFWGVRPGTPRGRAGRGE
ncbi:MAG: hypothetical protein M1824_000215 [Vezdaea acicularis]|nr:MAG: hypothetical protein M1824_000215 [Vezdaea acicularis]